MMQTWDEQSENNGALLERLAHERGEKYTPWLDVRKWRRRAWLFGLLWLVTLGALMRVWRGR